MVEVADTAGQEEYTAMRDLYIKSGHQFILAFSLSSRDSFTAVRRYHQQIQTIKQTSFPCVLVGNKCDLPSQDRQVSTEEGRALAQELGCEFLETSAKIGTNVPEVFHHLVRLDRRQKQEQESEAQASLPQPKKEERGNKGWRKRISTVLKSIGGRK